MLPALRQCWVPAPQVRRATRVAPQIDLLELRHGHAQGALYATEPGGPRALLRLGHLLQKVAAERIVGAADRPIGFPNELRNQVQVADGTEEHGQLTEPLIDVDLLEVGLGEPLRIRGILPVGPLDQCFPVTTHPLGSDARAPLLVLMERNLVLPRARRRPLLRGEPLSPRRGY